MGDPTNDEISAALAFVSSSHDTPPEFDATFFAMVAELQRHRAAEAASAETRVEELEDAICTAIDALTLEIPLSEIIERLQAVLDDDSAVAAKAASADRVRSVVREAAISLWPYGSAAHELPPYAAAIANRVASQLGPVGLSEEERATLVRLRANEVGARNAIGCLGTGIIEETDRSVALLDRILASSPPPTSTLSASDRALLQSIRDELSLAAMQAEQHAIGAHHEVHRQRWLRLRGMVDGLDRLLGVTP